MVRPVSPRTETSERRSVSRSLIRNVRFVQVELLYRQSIRVSKQIESVMRKGGFRHCRNMKGVSIMNAVGIDVSKGKSTVTIFRSHTEAVVPPVDVPHTVSGMKCLLLLFSVGFLFPAWLLYHFALLSVCKFFLVLNLFLLDFLFAGFLFGTVAKAPSTLDRAQGHAFDEVLLRKWIH